MPKYGEKYFIKHVVTDLFLYNDYLNNKMGLTSNGSLEACYFILNSKKESDEDENINS